MSENPYATPTAELNGGESRQGVFREIVIGWEKLRLWYNALLLVPGLAVVAMWASRQEIPLAALVVMAVPVALAANVCFFLGPLAEVYLRAMLPTGASLGRGRRLLFGAGLVVSLGVFAVCALMALSAPL